ncbi:MAG: hypothetical protein Q8P02_05265, partial [Candidatus Micrarchaeota archaeon]|nr:hypothetical protein [Candidatus Micrarchaeota archaeon]
MKSCFECSGKLVLLAGQRKGVDYEAYRCTQCGEVTFTMAQAGNYLKAAEEAKQAKVAQWAPVWPSAFQRPWPGR